MSEPDCLSIASPACPLCAAPTRLKEQRRRTRAAITCVFKCTACEVEYPMYIVPGEEGGQPQAT
ncbi:MAG: hypothetical protein Q8M24_22270 [Pseudolabrys sp.]|nr:hypothetical protein [Pseudolabrys sp.]